MISTHIWNLADGYLHALKMNANGLAQWVCYEASHETNHVGMVLT
mgnify:FL=1